jgi:hypothetical protein
MGQRKPVGWTNLLLLTIRVRGIRRLALLFLLLSHQCLLLLNLFAGPQWAKHGPVMIAANTTGCQNVAAALFRFFGASS